VKLLFDQNVSPDLVRRFVDLFPASEHVFRLGLDSLDDIALWQYARENEFVIVSKDADFSEISMLHGYPPKLLWLRIGNCTTDDIERLIRANVSYIRALAEDDTRGILSLVANNLI